MGQIISNTYIKKKQPLYENPLQRTMDSMIKPYPHVNRYVLKVQQIHFTIILPDEEWANFSCNRKFFNLFKKRKKNHTTNKSVQNSSQSHEKSKHSSLEKVIANWIRYWFFNAYRFTSDKVFTRVEISQHFCDFRQTKTLLHKITLDGKSNPCWKLYGYKSVTLVG